MVQNAEVSCIPMESHAREVHPAESCQFLHDLRVTPPRLRTLPRLRNLSVQDAKEDTTFFLFHSLAYSLPDRAPKKRGIAAKVHAKPENVEHVPSRVSGAHKTQSLDLDMQEESGA